MAGGYRARTTRCWDARTDAAAIHSAFPTDTPLPEGVAPVGA
ncbi:MAG: hypothetical protein ACK55E_15445 [Cyanobacteriota bacterium]